MAAMIIIILIALDQWSKGLVERLIGPSGHVTVIPRFFELRLSYNKGAAWSFLSDKSWGIILLCLISSVITMLLLYILKNTTGKRMRFVLIMLISGSAGNLIDRLRMGAVADFFSFTFGQYVFPTFNIADSLITVGTALLIIFVIFDRTFLDGFFDGSKVRRSKEKKASKGQELTQGGIQEDMEQLPYIDNDATESDVNDSSDKAGQANNKSVVVGCEDDNH